MRSETVSEQCRELIVCRTCDSLGVEASSKKQGVSDVDELNSKEKKKSETLK